MATGGQPSSSLRSANVACYLQDINTGKLYGVTNKHVAVHSEEIYIKKINRQEKTKLGTSVKSFKDEQLDFGLIEIDPVLECLLRNNEDPKQHVCIYQDSFKSIYCKEVIKYKPSGNYYEICKYDTSNCGVIASETEHKQFENMERQFFVKGINGDFATKGESGTAIAINTGKVDVTELIGILCGGSKDYAVCLFLPFIIRYFNEQFGFNFHLYQPISYFEINISQNCDVDVSKQVERFSGNTYIPSGLKIYFMYQTPEQIAPFEFDLVRRTLCLLYKRFTPVDLNKYKLLEKGQSDLSKLVNERVKLSESALFENDRVEFVAIEMGIKACDCLYLGKVTEAENHLKRAISCVSKSEDLASWLLCKTTSYITWCYLAQNSPESPRDLKEFLKEGIDIFESNFMDQKGFPLEALGYMYYDSSRLYMTMWENKRRAVQEEMPLIYTESSSYRCKAIREAKHAVTIFQKDHNNLQRPETMWRLVLAKCQTIYLLLCCGHSFEFSSENITTEEIKEADQIFNSIHTEKTFMPTVQYTYYLLSLCDLHYRKGCFSKALEAADECLELSDNKGHKVAFHRAKCRVQSLRNRGANRSGLLAYLGE